MKKEWTMRSVVVLISTLCLLPLTGCDEAEDTGVNLAALIGQMEPLQVDRGAEKGIETVTLKQALAAHEGHGHEHEHQHEHEHEHQHGVSNTAASAQDQVPQHVCLGVAVGYQAIRYAVGELFPDSVPQPSNVDIKVSGAMSGVWNVMSLYAGRELKFEGEAKKLGLESFTFTAREISTDKSLVFQLQPGVIPEAFFRLKNQGATCANPEVGKAKEQALLNVLSAEPKECFRLLEGKADASIRLRPGSVG
jgi:hypothetical protein